MEPTDSAFGDGGKSSRALWDKGVKRMPARYICRPCRNARKSGHEPGAGWDLRPKEGAWGSELRAFRADAGATADLRGRRLICADSAAPPCALLQHCTHSSNGLSLAPDFEKQVVAIMGARDEGSPTHPALSVSVRANPRPP